MEPYYYVAAGAQREASRMPGTAIAPTTWRRALAGTSQRRGLGASAVPRSPLPHPTPWAGSCKSAAYLDSD